MLQDLTLWSEVEQLILANYPQKKDTYFVSAFEMNCNKPSSVLHQSKKVLIENKINSGESVILFGNATPTMAHQSIKVDFESLGSFTISGKLNGPCEPAATHILNKNYTWPVNNQHPSTCGCDTVRLYKPWQIKDELKGKGHPIVEVKGVPLLLAKEFETGGRLVIIPNMEMFCPPFIGDEDNAKLFTSIISWTYGHDASPIIDTIDNSIKNDLNTSYVGLPNPGEFDLTREDSVIDLSKVKEEISDLCQEIPDYTRDLKGFLREAALRYSSLPKTIRRRLYDFKRESNDYGAFLVRGLPVEEKLPDTPKSSTAPDSRNSQMSEFILAMICHGVGTPYAYAQEKRGAVFQNMVPTKENEYNLSSESSSILLDYHTEAAFHPYLPDYVLLSCLRSDHEKKARTISASSRMIISHLTHRTRSVLSKPLYKTGVDYSFGSQNGTKGNGPTLPILKGDPGDPDILYDLDLMIPLTNEAEIALTELRRVAAQVGCWTVLTPGDLLIVDNRKAVHARSEFKARYDGKDRWILRTTALIDFERSRDSRMTESAILDTQFAV